MSVQLKVKDIVWMYQRFFDLVIKNWHGMSLPAIAQDLTELARDKNVAYTSLNYRMIMLTDGVQLDLLNSSLTPVVYGKVTMNVVRTSVGVFMLDVKDYNDAAPIYAITRNNPGMVSPYYINHWMDNLSGVL